MQNLEKGALPLREAIERLEAQVLELSNRRMSPPISFSGDGSTTAFTLPRGKTPWQVFHENDYQIKGSGDDYTTSFDGFDWTVTFIVAPGAGTAINVYPEELV